MSHVQIHPAIGHLRQVDEAVLQPQQFQIAGGAIQAVAAASGIHTNGHIVIAELAGHVHGKHGLSGFKIQHDILPHAGAQILHIAVDIAGGSGQLHHGGIPQVVSAPDALHLIAAVGLDGIHPLHAGHNHGVALGQPVDVVDIGIALDGGIAVLCRQLGAACAEPVAHNGADGTLAVVIDNSGVFHGDRALHLVKNRHAGNHLAGLHVQGQQVHRVLVVGEHHQILGQGRRAAAAPGQAAAGGLVAGGAVLGTCAFIGGTPHLLNAAVGPQQVAIQIGQNHCAVLAGGDTVFHALAGDQRVDIYRLGQVCFAAAEDFVNGLPGDVAHGTQLLPVGVDAEAAGGKPEIPLIVEDHGQQILVQGLPQGSLCRSLDVDVQQLLELRQDIARLVGGLEHQHMVVAGGADNPVGLIHKGIGALNHISAAVMLLGGEIAQGFCLLCINIPNGNAPQQGNHRMVIGIEENRRRGVGIGLFVGDIDFGVDAQGQHLVGAVGVVAVVMNVGIAVGHVGIHVHRLGGQGLDGQGSRMTRAADHRRQSQGQSNPFDH